MTIGHEEIKCKKNANNLLLAPFFEAFIGGVSSAHGEEKVKKVSLRRDLEEKQRQIENGKWKILYSLKPIR